MKPFLQAVSVITLALISLSCAKPLPEHDPEEAGSQLVPVLFVPEGATKGTEGASALESRVNRWTVFAFGSDGSWKYRTSETGGTVSLSLKAGLPYRIAAAANYPLLGPGALNPSLIRTEADLSGKTALLQDNSPGSFLLYGSQGFTPQETAPGETPALLPVTVQRLVSRVDVRKVSVDFSGASELTGKPFTLKHIFLTNVYRTSRFGSDCIPSELSAARSAWYNTMGWHRGETADASLDALLADRDIDRSIPDGGACSDVHTYYCFPNPVPSAQDTRTTDAWSVRCTRVVIAGEIDGTLYYYPIQVPDMRRNVIYSADNVLIRSRGSLDPESMDPGPDTVVYTLSIVKADGNSASGLKVAVGGTHSLKALYRTFTNGILTATEDVTAMGTWSSPEGNASVSSDGVVTGLHAGAATVTVTAAPDGKPVSTASVPISVITWTDDWEDDPEIEL